MKLKSDPVQGQLPGYHCGDETEPQNVQAFTFHSSFVGVTSFIAEW